MPHIKSIEEATSIMPDIVADSVVEKAARLLNAQLDAQTLSAYLIGHAEATYQASKSFHKKINSMANHGNAGRDSLYIYMQHWLSSKLLRDSNRDPRVQKILVESGFSMGRDI